MVKYKSVMDLVLKGKHWKGLTVFSLLLCPNFQRENVNPFQENINCMAHSVEFSARHSAGPAVLLWGQCVDVDGKLCAKPCDGS